MVDDLAIGVTVFKRINKLKTLLESIDAEIVSTVYVADDGELTERKMSVYNQTYPFDLELFDLPFDAGIGAGRARIVNALEEDYFLLMDSDMEMPPNVEVLYQQLNEKSDLGGVCGLFIEDERIFSSGCIDIFEDNNICTHGLRKPKKTTSIAGYPFVNFDMIANAALFKRECVEEYTWDPEYVIGREHVDFYYGHKKTTDWSFGLCPSVLFPHNPGGSKEYLKHRWSTQKYDTATKYFMDKWSLEGYKPISHTYIDTYDVKYGGFPPHGIVRQARQKYRDEGASKLIIDSSKYILELLENKLSR